MIKIIESSERLNNSAFGSPRYRVTFADGTVMTSQLDASWCYGFGDPGLRNGDTVAIEVSRTGRISHMSPVQS